MSSSTVLKNFSYYILSNFFSLNTVLKYISISLFVYFQLFCQSYFRLLSLALPHLGPRLQMMVNVQRNVVPG